jgi:hypothetical protein
MTKTKSTCRRVDAYLTTLLLEHQPVPVEARNHIAVCPDCASELASMQSTMGILDERRAPDPGPFFDTRLNACLRQEKANAPAGLLERLRARILYSDLRVRPWAMGTVVVLLVMGSGTFTVLNKQTGTVNTSLTVRELQCYDGDAQVIQQLGSLDSDDESSVPVSQ